MSVLLVETSRIDSAAQFLTVLFAFVFVLFITLAGTRFIANYHSRQLNSKNFESIEGYRLSNNKYLQLIRIGGRYFVIAVGKEEVTLIGEFSEDELEFSGEGSGQSLNSFGKLFTLTRDKLQDRGKKTDDGS